MAVSGSMSMPKNRFETANMTLGELLRPCARRHQRSVAVHIISPSSG